MSLERLASGLRINRAADDAAGLGVSTNLETEQISSRMALRNVQDAMEMVNTAEGGLHEISDLLMRFATLEATNGDLRQQAKGTSETNEAN